MRKKILNLQYIEEKPRFFFSLRRIHFGIISLKILLRHGDMYRFARLTDDAAASVDKAKSTIIIGANT
jgi:hypothetical protein